MLEFRDNTICINVEPCASSQSTDPNWSHKEFITEYVLTREVRILVSSSSTLYNCFLVAASISDDTYQGFRHAHLISCHVIPCPVAEESAPRPMQVALFIKHIIYVRAKLTPMKTR
jgi:hypothetical protein